MGVRRLRDDGPPRRALEGSRNHARDARRQIRAGLGARSDHGFDSSGRRCWFTPDRRGTSVSRPTIYRRLNKASNPPLKTGLSAPNLPTGGPGVSSASRLSVRTVPPDGALSCQFGLTR